MPKKARPDMALLAEIALAHLGVETLEDRHSDNLDFHEVSVWSLRAALADAFAAGQAAAALADTITKGK